MKERMTQPYEISKDVNILSIETFKITKTNTRCIL